MDVIDLKPTEDTPGVILDKDNGKFEMSGRSLPEDVNAFYDPIISWIEEYAENPNPKTEFVFKMDYFNTASSKILLDILLTIAEIKEAGNDLNIKWIYKSYDTDMKDAGEEYQEIAEVNFEMIETE